MDYSIFDYDDTIVLPKDWVILSTHASDNRIEVEFYHPKSKGYNMSVSITATNIKSACKAFVRDWLELTAQEFNDLIKEQSK